MKKVDILLSTYNGEKYICELLDSLVAQTYKNIKIIIRDDGSCDKTKEILNKYKKNYEDIFEIIPSEENIGYVQSFFSLIRISKGDYIALCDQDDVWFKDKIKNYVDEMEKIESANNKKPTLLTSEVLITDENLKGTSKGYNELNSINPAELTEGSVLTWPQGPGWTLMFNQELRKILIFPNKEEKISHDNFLVMSAIYFGEYHYLNKTTGLYRQHRNNTKGYKENKTIKHYIHVWKHIKNKYLNTKRSRARLFAKLYDDKLNERQKIILSQYICLNEKNIFERINIIKKNRYFVKDIKHNLPLLLY